MEDEQNGRRPEWKTTKIDDDQNGRQPKWNMTKLKDDPNFVQTVGASTQVRSA